MSPIQNSLTIIDLLNRASNYFKQKNIESPRLNAERLLSSVLNVDRLQLYLQHERILSRGEISLYRDRVRRRGSNEPLQYIIGTTEFMGLHFKSTPAALIPRPETEILVEKVVDLSKRITIEQPVIWDIGTGGGCIAISICTFWSEVQMIASDISEVSLQLARENAKNLGVSDRIRFLRHDILKDQIISSMNPDIMVSNPPYISRKEYTTLPVEITDHEPRIALTDEDDGLTFYRKIFSLFEKCAQSKFIFVELSGTQTEKIIQLVNSIPDCEYNVFEDLNSIPRVLELKRR